MRYGDGKMSLNRPAEHNEPLSACTRAVVESIELIDQPGDMVNP